MFPLGEKRYGSMLDHGCQIKNKTAVESGASSSKSVAIANSECPDRLSIPRQ